MDSTKTSQNPDIELSIVIPMYQAVYCFDYKNLLVVGRLAAQK